MLYTLGLTIHPSSTVKGSPHSYFSLCPNHNEIHTPPPAYHQNMTKDLPKFKKAEIVKDYQKAPK